MRSLTCRIRCTSSLASTCNVIVPGNATSFGGGVAGGTAAAHVIPNIANTQPTKKRMSCTPSRLYLLLGTIMTTRDRLVESAQALLWERGYVAMSPKAVQERSGAGQGSMYHHFKGKAE